MLFGICLSDVKLTGKYKKVEKEMKNAFLMKVKSTTTKY